VKKPAWIAPDGLLRWDEDAMTMRCNPWPQVLNGDVRRGFCGCVLLHIHYTTLCLKYQPIPHTNTHTPSLEPGLVHTLLLPTWPSALQMSHTGAWGCNATL
jgi:hypothetical protein